MGPEANIFSRKIIQEDTGLSEGQFIEICAHIENLYGRDLAKMPMHLTLSGFSHVSSLYPKSTNLKT